MSDLLSKLGIDWRLFSAQAANFALVLVVLRFTVYRPLLDILRKRKEKIEKGMRDAALAEERLSGADKLVAEKVAEGEKQAIAILEATEQKSRAMEEKLVVAAKRREAEIILEAQHRAAAEIKNERERFHEEAAGLVRKAIEKTVELSPEMIDEKLIRKALGAIKESQT